MAAPNASVGAGSPARSPVPFAGAARERLPALAISALLHAAALVGLLRFAPSSPPPPPVIEMELVAPQPPQSPRPIPARPEPPPPPPTVPRPPTVVPAFAWSSRVPAAPPAESTAEQPVPATAPGPAPAPAREASAAPTVREPPAPATRALPQESPITPPAFDAAYLDNPAPRYPPAALRLRESGRVLLSVMVSASGQPERVEIARSSGSPRLDQAALETVRRWRFVPARQGERAVAAQVTVPLVFRLDE